MRSLRLALPALVLVAFPLVGPIAACGDEAAPAAVGDGGEDGTVPREAGGDGGAAPGDGGDAATVRDASLDSGLTDAGSADGGPTDAGPTDAGPTDAGSTDAGPTDAGSSDGGPSDGGPSDAGRDSGACPIGETLCAGACVDTAVSAAHCGGCGRACAPAQAIGACVASACTIAACNAGFADCDRIPANGCETDTRSSAQNCGGCGRACGAGRVCVASACQ